MRTISALWTILLIGLVCLTATAEDLSITPTNVIISASGLPGGPFILGPTNLTLTNVGTATLNWSLATTANWLSASPSSGLLNSGGGGTNVTVSLTPAANSLPFGNYSANIWFTNLNDSIAQAVPVTLTVDLAQNGGFETGDFTDWTFTGDASANFVTNSAFPFPVFPPHSGIYQVLFGGLTEVPFSHVTQTIQTVPGQLYQISFWVNCDDETPNGFSFAWNGQTLFTNQLTTGNFTPNVWSNFQFTVTAISNHTIIDFAAANDNNYTALDEVSVQPFVVAPLAFQSITKSNSSLQLTWNSISGVVYQLQYNTNLGGTNWINIGNSITAMTSTVSTSTSITSDPDRFYRVQQLP
jgi:hypothetical protein